MVVRVAGQTEAHLGSHERAARDGEAGIGINVLDREATKSFLLLTRGAYNSL